MAEALDIISPAQAAGMIGISERTLRHHARNGRIGYQPNGPGCPYIFTKTDTQRFINDYERKVGNPNWSKGR